MLSQDDLKEFGLGPYSQEDLDAIQQSPFFQEVLQAQADYNARVKRGVTLASVFACMADTYRPSNPAVFQPIHDGIAVTEAGAAYEPLAQQTKRMLELGGARDATYYVFPQQKAD